MDFSEKLKLLRKERHLTQEEASDLIKIALSSLRKYEQVGKPDVPQLIKIKEFYGVSYDYLLNDKCTTRNVDNLEIVNNLGVKEQTVDNIRNFENKKLLDVLFANSYNKDILIFLEEQAQTQYICDFVLDRFCRRLYKTQNYNIVTETATNIMEILINYLKHTKIKQNYWDFIMNTNEINNFITSLEYIVNCWTNKKEILTNDKNISYFNDEIIISVREKLTEYKKYCYQSFSSILNGFCDNYKENKIFDI